MDVAKEDTPMADIDPKALALSATVKRITDLQQQMTDHILAVATEIEKMRDMVPVQEANPY